MKIAEAKATAKHLVVIDGKTIKGGYRLSVYGGVVEGVQTLDFTGKDEAVEWLMGQAYPFYSKMGKTIRPSL